MILAASLVRSLERLIFVAALSGIVGGCTEERALALKTAAETFAQKASTAIDAVVELHLRAALGKPEAEESKIKDTKKALILTQSQKPSELGAVINNQFRWVNEREKLRRDAFADYDKLKISYEEFAAAYRRLPEGSALATKDVACSAALGARLTKYMADAGKALAQSAPPLTVEGPVSQSALAAAAAHAVKTKDEGPLDEAVRAHVSLLRDRDRANAQAVAALADAAEAGVATVELIEKYSDVSAADVLKALRSALAARESALGLSSKAQIERLDNVISKLNSKPALAKALQAPLNQPPESCN